MFLNLNKSFLSFFKKKRGNSGQYKAFTLAEVLITLGIIGIVAAMTIPTLMNNVEHQQYVVALKKVYSQIDNGFSQLLADEGVESLDDTSVFKSMNSTLCTQENVTDNSCKTFFTNLGKYIKLSKVVAPSGYIWKKLGTNYSKNLSGITLLAFPDGMVALVDFGMRSMHGDKDAIIAAGGHMYGYQGDIEVDINGFKKPNTYGRDLFFFYLDSDGKLYPMYGKDYSIYSGSSAMYWREDTSSCGVEGSKNISNVDGTGCAARIMEEGWQMNY